MAELLRAEPVGDGDNDDWIAEFLSTGRRAEAVLTSSSDRLVVADDEPMPVNASAPAPVPESVSESTWTSPMDEFADLDDEDAMSFGAASTTAKVPRSGLPLLER